MPSSNRYFSPSEAACRLGVSAKALRLYEQRGLVAPLRTEAGWRAYGPADMARAEEIAALRALGFSLAQVARVLKGARRASNRPWPRITRSLRTGFVTSSGRWRRFGACGTTSLAARPRRPESWRV